MTKKLSSKDVGQLLAVKGEQLANGEGDADELIHEVLEVIGQSANVRARNKAVDLQGRVSVGRDLAGTRGLLIFHPSALGADSEHKRGY